MTDSPLPEFLNRRRQAEVRGSARWSPFKVVGERLEALVADLVARASLAPGSTVIDPGCADQPYRGLFDGHRYIGVDLPGNPLAELQLLEDGTVPLPDGSADLVLSTQVLEHVPDPAAYLAECHRLLAPGGALVLTTHGIMYLHRDPVDYWRWTGDGLRLLVATAGFEVVEVRGVLGLVGAALQLFQDGTGSSIPRRLRKPYVAVFQALIALADRAASDEGRRDNGLVLGVLARRPAAPD